SRLGALDSPISRAAVRVSEPATTPEFDRRRPPGQGDPPQIARRARGRAPPAAPPRRARGALARGAPTRAESCMGRRRMSQGHRKQLGRILLQQRALSAEQLERALSDRAGGRLASRLTEQGTISDLSALKALSEQHGIPGIDLSQICLRLDDL